MSAPTRSASPSRPWAWAATVRFASTDSAGNTDVTWKERARPSFSN